MPNGFESFGYTAGPAEQPTEEERKEEFVSEEVDIPVEKQQSGVSGEVSNNSDVLAALKEITLTTEEGGADSSENSGDLERNLEDEQKMREIGRAAETQNRLELARETLNRVKEAGANVLGEVTEFVQKAARAFKKFVVTTVAVISIASILTACGVAGDKLATTPEASDPQLETTALSGEQNNGVTYDYSHYADRKGKESDNAYDYSLADCYGDREATTQGIMAVAGRTPEALASYAFAILTPDEKAELNLTDKTMVEIDDMISNDPNGGILQQKIIAKLRDALNDPDTVFKFYKENDFETSSYVYFIDDNDDGIMSPTELHIGYADVQRNGSPQVDIKRPKNSKRPLASGTSSSGKWETAYYITDINLSCGGQVNYDEGDFPPGVPYVDPNNKNPNPQPSTTPDPKNQKEADKNSGASAGIVTPEKQERQTTPEPTPDKAHEYDSETKTYYYAPEEQASQIDYEVTYNTGESDTGGETTSEDGPANDFDASASVGTGEVAGDTPSADGSGNTIQYNLDNATGNTQANPAGDYSEGF